VGLEDVTLLAIRIGKQRNARRTVRIVLNRDHSGRDSGLIALEIDVAQLTLVPAATEPTRHIPRVAPSSGLVFPLSQRLVRPGGSQVRARKRRAITQRLGCRSVSLDCHKSALSC